MQTQTIERTETDERVDDGTDSDTPKYFHYVKKDKIAESAVMGTHVVALCGEVFPVTKAAKPGSPVCPDCKRIYETAQEELTAIGAGVARCVRCVLGVVAPSALVRDTSHRRSRWAWVRGAGHSSWIAALNSAPSMMAKPAKKANNRNAIGVASAP